MRTWIEYLIIFLFPLFYVFYLLDFGTSIFGNLGDTRLNLILLEHNFQKFILGKELSYFFFFPETQYVYLGENHLFNTIYYAPFRLLGFSPWRSIQYWIYVVFILNFISFYKSGRWLQFSKGGAFIGAFVFTFSLPVIQQTGHLQMLPRFFIPLMIASLLYAFRVNSVKHILMALIFLALQLIINIYTGVFSSILMIIIIMFHIPKIMKYRRFLWLDFRKQRWWLIGFIVIFGLLILNYIPYVHTMNELGSRSWQDIIHYLPSLKSLFLVSQFSDHWLFINKLLSIPWNHELATFPGLIPSLALLILPIVYWKNRNREVLLIYLTLIFTVILTLNFFGFSFYRVLFHIPGFSALRAIGRIIGTQLVLISLIVAYLVDSIVPTKHRFFYVGVILVLLLIDQKVTVFDKLNVDRMETYHEKLVMEFEEVDKDIDAFVFTLDQRKDILWKMNVDAMYVSLQTGKPTLNGYSGNTPKGYNLASGNNSKKKVLDWLAYNKSKLPSPIKIAYIHYQNAADEKLFRNIEYVNFE